MSNEIPLTIVGNLTKDPELRYRPGGGEAVLRFTVASTPRYRLTGESAPPFRAEVNRRAQLGRDWFSMYCLNTEMGAPPTDPAK